MAADEFGKAVHYGSRPDLERPAEHRGGESVVDEKRSTRPPRNACYRVELGRFAKRVADGLGDHKSSAFGAVPYGNEIAHVDRPDLIAQRLQVAAQHGERRAVRVSRRHYRRRARDQRQDGDQDRGHPRAGGDAGFGTLELGDGCFQNGDVLVRVAAIDMARDFTRGDRVIVLEVAEDVDGALYDRRRQRVASLDLTAGVNRLRGRLHWRLRRDPPA